MDVPEKRYSIRKASGSRYAYVIDNSTGGAVRRFDVLRGDGWGKADKLRDRLNDEHEAEKERS
ncbi:MAG: hypothetical protein EKK41_05105 [Hyphomicrobiales bacterium]|nr:MAG: hypothetical protein EKK41_05105 [Hyphomicrobiales bacterium]